MTFGIPLWIVIQCYLLYQTTGRMKQYHREDWWGGGEKLDLKWLEISVSLERAVVQYRLSQFKVRWIRNSVVFWLRLSTKSVVSFQSSSTASPPRHLHSSVFVKMTWWEFVTERCAKHQQSCSARFNHLIILSNKTLSLFHLHPEQWLSKTRCTLIKSK